MLNFLNSFARLNFGYLLIYFIIKNLGCYKPPLSSPPFRACLVWGEGMEGEGGKGKGGKGRVKYYFVWSDKKEGREWKGEGKFNDYLFG